MSSKNKLLELSKGIRRNIIDLTFFSGKNGAHIGGSLSIVEILTVLYGKLLNFDVNNPLSKNRDRFILSKGHSALALFSVLEKVGFLSKNELNKFEVNGSPYYSHAKKDLKKGIEFSGGSLSLGLSFGVGVALSCKIDKLNNHIYVLIGDGECDEGLVWESLMSASQFNLSNLTVIVDFNKQQSDGFSKDIIEKNNLSDKFSSFGFKTIVADGHSIDDLINSFDSRDSSKPNAIIANTIKGKGVSFMEDSVDWHHGILSKDQYKKAISEQK